MNRIFCTFVLFFALSVTVYATDATLNTRNLRVADIAKAEAKAKAIVAGNYSSSNSSQSLPEHP